MPRLAGAISLTGLPAHRGLILNVCFFAVKGPDATAPYNGDPPPDAATDCDKVFERVDLETESNDTRFDHTFNADRPTGYYFVQVRAILFRMQAGKVVAQAEQFFFGDRPVQIASEANAPVPFPVSWPALPVEELQHYGTVSPQSKKP